jgi:sugar phosphate isomerase/epimerase
MNSGTSSGVGSGGARAADPIRVGLSTASVYPQNAEAAFRYAAELGYDGVELMVWAEPASQSLRAVRSLMGAYEVPVLAVHAPCLLISQRVWGADPIAKLSQAVRMAAELGAPTVVVHPPFRWQRRYAEGFAAQVAELEATTSVHVAVENMFPMRADRFFGAKDNAVARMQRRGGGPGLAVSAFSPSIDPTDARHAHYTLDLSHTATAGVDGLALALKMGAGLTHLHLADGRGAAYDEHLIPGRGGQPCAEVCEHLARSDFAGQVVLEINTQNAKTTHERAAMLAEALAFARTHLDRPSRPVAVPSSESVDSGDDRRHA